MKVEEHECDFVRYKCHFCQKIQTFTCSDCFKTYSKNTTKHKCIPKKAKKLKKDVKIVEKRDDLKGDEIVEKRDDYQGEKIKIQKDKKEKDTINSEKRKKEIEIEKKRKEIEIEKNNKEIETQKNKEIEIEKRKKEVDGDEKIQKEDNTFQDDQKLNEISKQINLGDLKGWKVDFDSFTIKLKDFKKFELRSGTADINLYKIFQSYKHHSQILLGSLDSINISLVFKEYSPRKIFKVFLESIFGQSRVDLPRSMDDINKNYPPPQRIRINSDTLIKILQDMFAMLEQKDKKDLINEEDGKKEFQDDFEEIIFGETKDFELVFSMNGLKGDVENLVNKLNPFTVGLFTFEIDMCLCIEQKIISKEIEQLKKYEYLVMGNIRNYHARKIYHKESNYYISKINFYNNIKSLWLGNNKVHSMFKNNGVFLTLCKIWEKKNKLKDELESIQKLMEWIIIHFKRSSLRLEFTIDLEEIDYNLLLDRGFLMIIIKNLFEWIPNLSSSIGTFESPNLEPLQNLIIEFQKMEEVEKFFDINNKIISFFNGRGFSGWTFLSFEKYYQKQIYSYMMNHNMEFAMELFHNKYLVITNRKSSKTISWIEYFRLIKQNDKIDFSKIDPSNIKNNGENFVYMNTVYTPSGYSSTKFKFEEDFDPIVQEALDKSNFQKVLDRFNESGKKCDKSKKFDEWVKNLRGHLNISVPFIVYAQFFKKKKYSLVPAFKGISKNGNLKFRAELDRVAELDFSEYNILIEDSKDNGVPVTRFLRKKLIDEENSGEKLISEKKIIEQVALFKPKLIDDDEEFSDKDKLNVDDEEFGDEDKLIVDDEEFGDEDKLNVDDEEFGDEDKLIVDEVEIKENVKVDDENQIKKIIENESGIFQKYQVDSFF
jgi:hypothetical protein